MTLWNIFDWRNSLCTPIVICNSKFLSPFLQLFRVLYWILLLVARNTDFHICEVVLDHKVLFMTYCLSSIAFTLCDIILYRSVNRLVYTF